MDFILHPQSYEHLVALLCGRLCLQEIKSLSLVSKGWFQATSSAIGEKCKISSKNLLRCQRKYKTHKISSAEELQKLVEWFKHIKRKERIFYISSISLKNILINENTLHLLKQLERLQTLTTEDCDFSINNKKLPNISIDLKELRIIDYRDENGASSSKPTRKIIRSIFKDNPKLTDVSLVVGDFSFYEDLLTDPLLLQNLEALDLSVYSPETNKTYEQILRVHHNLKSITLLVDFDDAKVQKLLEICPKIESISKIETDNMKRSTLERLPTFENLKNLTVSLRDGKNMRKLARVFIPQLKHLQFDGFGIRVQEQCFQGILKAVPNLTSIDLRLDFSAVRGNVFSILAKALPNLEKLVLVRLVIREELEIPVEEATFPKLEVLLLYYSEVIGSILTAVHAPQLKEFFAYRTDGKALVHLIKECKFLERVFLASALNVTDEMVTFMFQNGKFLKYLHLEETKDLSVKVIDGFLESFVSTVALKVEGIDEHDDIFKRAEEKGFSVTKNENGGCFVLSNGFRKMDIVSFRKVLYFGAFNGSLSFNDF